MKKTKRFISFLICIILVCNTFFISVYASESDTKDEWVVEKDVTDEMKPLNKFIHKTKNLLWYLAAQCGAVVQADLLTLSDNNEWIEKIDKYGVVVRNTTTGDLGIKFEKGLTDDLLNNLKEQTKEPDNGGYELVKTVPASKISSLYFSSPARYTTFKNLLKDNGGIIGLQVYGGYANCYYKILPDVFWVSGGKHLYKDSNGTHEFYRADGYKNTLSSVTRYNAYDISKADVPAKSWNDVGTNLYMSSAVSHEAYRFLLNDSFTYFADSKNVSNPLTQGAYLVTATGAPIPVFNTVSDAVAYSVANNLYYTSSDYTGEGKEIIIPFDEIDKILNGYYNGMYDLLQQLIEQNGGNALTPEQLQKLVDEVKASFGMIQDSINAGFEQQDILIQKNSEIMQNIADALNAFFSQSKEFRNTFIKSFNDYAKSEKERDEMLYRLLSDYLDGKKDNPDSGENAGGDETEENFLQRIYDTVKNGFDDVVKELKKIKHWNALDTVLDGAGAVGEWVSFLTDLLDPEKGLDTLTDFVKEGTVALDGMTELVDGKFPFCIPIDILLLMETLSAEPEAPKFEIPFVLERYGIDEKITIDLKDFRVVSDISRTFLTILWCCSLMNFTTKITDMKSI